MVFALLMDTADAGGVTVTVDELAEIVLTAKYGHPWAATMRGYPWTDLLAEDGVVFDCGGVECAPDAPATREQLAMALALEAAGDNPPPGLRLTGDPWTDVAEALGWLAPSDDPLVTVDEAEQAAAAALSPTSSMTIDTWQYDS